MKLCIYSRYLGQTYTSDLKSGSYAFDKAKILRHNRNIVSVNSSKIADYTYQHINIIKWKANHTLKVTDNHCFTTVLERLERERLDAVDR